MTTDDKNEPLTPLTITDGNKNILARIPYNNHEISIQVIANSIINKFAKMNTEHEYMKSVLATIQFELMEQKNEILDQKEAFEHADDSLQNLRETVSSLDVMKGAGV